MDQDIVAHLKTQFRDFCGLLTVKEITTNVPLMRVIERFERVLNEVSSGELTGKEQK